MASLNKISNQSTLSIPPFQVGLPGGATFMIPVGQGNVSSNYPSQYPQVNTKNPTSGHYFINPGLYSEVQEYDYIMDYWRPLSTAPGAAITISGDGANYRIANTTGCPVGAVITNHGTGLTNGFNTVTITPSAGSSVWNTIVGGAINATITVTAGGTLYVGIPSIVFAPPATQGSTPYILPTAVAVMSGGAISSVTVIDQGAGLVAVPSITVVPAVGDSTGGGASLTINATLAGSGQLLAMYPAATTWNADGSRTPLTKPYGDPQTTVPTFTFSPVSSLAATAIMNFAVTSVTASQQGAAYVNAGAVFTGGTVVATPASGVLNPTWQKNISVPMWPQVNVTATTGIVTCNGFLGRNIQAVPVITVVSDINTGSMTEAQMTPVVGAANDVITIHSM